MSVFVASDETVPNNNLPDWVDFALGEDVRDERRLEQDRQWSKAVSDGRVHFSHREFALKYGDRFLSAVDDFQLTQLLIAGMFSKSSILNRLEVEVLTIIISYALPGQGPLVRAIVNHMLMKNLFYEERLALAEVSSSFKICLRKRPLQDVERRDGAYDVSQISQDSLLLHEGKLARNGRLLSMTHHQFVFDSVFDEFESNSDVCARCVAPLLTRLAAGHSSTLICFGQTGTGKTYTLYGALEYIAHQMVGKSVRFHFYEVHGNHCYDLLNERQKVFIRFDEKENVHLRRARCVELHEISSAEQMMTELRVALRLRSSLITERNPISSRSHAVCTITLLHPTPAEATPIVKQENESADGDAMKGDYLPLGKITLVDLAGSERNYETTAMSGNQHKESADINLALMSLKNCFRAYHQNLIAKLGRDNVMQIKKNQKPMKAGTTSNKAMTLQRIPYRASTLTKVLKDCFTCENNSHFSTIIATISPTPMDLQHSLNTINHVLLMSTYLSKYTNHVSVEIPKTSLAALSNIPLSQWSEHQVNAWLATVERGKFAHLALPRGTDGKGLLQLSIMNITSLFEEQERSGRQQSEGPRWVIGANETNRLALISQQLFVTIRREERFYQHNVD